MTTNQHSVNYSASYPVNIHKAYHTHVYFDANSAELAKTLCEQVQQQFALSVGRFHERLVGPHPRWSCQITFGTKHFDQLIPWLEQNRAGLTIFVHGLTGNDLKDHTDYAYWLGDAVPLNLAVFQEKR